MLEVYDSSNDDSEKYEKRAMTAFVTPSFQALRHNVSARQQNPSLFRTVYAVSPQNSLIEVTVVNKDEAETRRYPKRERNASLWFSINFVVHIHDHDDPTTKQTLNGEDKTFWKAAIRTKVETLEQMRCRNRLLKTKETRSLQTKFVIKRNRNKQGTAKHYWARLVVCGSKEKHFNEDNFCPVADLTIAKMVMCLAFQNGCYNEHLDFENAFPNGQLDLPDIAELPKHYRNESDWTKKVLGLKGSLYCLKYVALI